MTNLTEVQRQRIRQRAGNRCEYCLSFQEYDMGRLQIDHVKPISKGCSNTEDNLCLACELCNQYKWNKSDSLDPLSGKRVPLFNPRKQSWSEHFIWSADGTEIIGITACGRATVVALKLNNDYAVTVRRNWIKAGWHPPI